jgi:hypothetical protein
VSRVIREPPAPAIQVTFPENFCDPCPAPVSRVIREPPAPAIQVTFPTVWNFDATVTTNDHDAIAHFQPSSLHPLLFFKVVHWSVSELSILAILPSSAAQHVFQFHSHVHSSHSPFRVAVRPVV